VVVDEFDIFRAIRAPAKTHAELVVHANAVLPGSSGLTFERLMR